ncbi:MAG: hypothetical protein JNK58_08785 [Phycisphaerae bacterium]|nr:hypothetical protein [Phycisphaerae bacterium]
MQGLTPAERRHVVLKAVAEQQVQVDSLIDALFAGVRQETVEASRPLSYWANLARENARNPPAQPVDFWARQEALRKQRQEANSLFPAGPLANREAPVLRPGVGTGLSPVEFATGQRQAKFNQPSIGLPPPVKIASIQYDQIFKVTSEVTSPIGRIVDVVA